MTSTTGNPFLDDRFDVNDRGARKFNIGGSLVGSVFDPNSNIVCPLSTFSDAALAGYGVSFGMVCPVV